MTTERAATTTILFSDLVGSTELMQRAGDDDAQRIFKAHYQLLRDAVSANGGAEVKSLGDGLMVAFASTADAVRCAIAMQQAARRPVSGERITIRIGINAGDALRDEGDYFGTAVVTARRLCDRAGPGQILCSAVVEALLAGRQAFSFRDLGELELKGITTPIATREVVYETEQAGLVLSRTPFVGRDAEIARVKGKLADARTGRGGLVMLVGEPGIGKSRMIEEFTEHARNEGSTVLFGACFEGEWVPPFAPFAEAIEDYAKMAPVEMLQADLGHSAGAVSRLAPSLRDRLPDFAEPAQLQPDEERFRLLDAVSQFLIATSERAPVVLVLDDLHWADKGTIAMMRHVARFVTKHRILILGAYRDVELDRQHPLSDALAQLRREVEYERIALKGLDESDIGAMLTSITEQEVPEAFVRAISDETDGNPFFVREVLIHLTEEGKIFQQDGRWTSNLSIAEMGIPEGVRQVIGRRLSRLSDSANKLMTAASGFNGPFHIDLAGAAAALDENAALDALDEALQSQLLRSTGEHDTYNFTHALIRHTLYGELSPSRQVRLHRQIAEAMERVYGDRAKDHAAEHAFQFHQSSAVSGAERGVPHALAAADQAESSAAWDEAIAFLRMAEELMQDQDRTRSRVLARLGLMLANVVHAVQAETICADAGERILREEGEDAAGSYFADASLACSRAGLTLPAWRFSQRALELLGERRDDAWVVATYIDIFRREAEDPQYVGMPLPSRDRDELIAVAATLESELSRTLLLTAMTLLPPFRSREEAVAFGAAQGSEPLERSLQMFWLGDYRAAATSYTTAMREAERAGLPAFAMAYAADAARAHQALGDLKRADELIAYAQTIAGRLSGSSPQLILFVAAVDERAYLRGEGWQEHLAANASLTAQPDAADRWVGAAIQTGVARIFAKLGLSDPAVDLIRQAMPSIERVPGAAGNYNRMICCAVDALWELGRTDHAEDLERNIREKVVQPDFRYVSVDGRLSLARLCALQGRHDEAIDWFSKARTVLDEQGARPLRAIVDHDEALMYVRRNADGDKGRALPLLETAMQQFAEIGMTGWTRRAEELRASLRSPSAG